MFDLDFPRLLGQPASQGVIRSIPEDFQVDEDLGVAFSGAGEHVFLHVRKRGDNTPWVARQIAKLAQVKPADVSYAGLKDRHAVTTQWFSVWLPGKTEPDWQQLDSDSIQVLAVERHHRKLRRGAHRANVFQLRVRDLSEADDLLRRVARLREQGVPNYFGEQRFGHQGSNLNAAQSVLLDGRKVRDRNKRSLYLSAARSYLFNRVLARRIETSSLSRYLAGDCLMQDGSKNLFYDFDPAGVDQAIARLELHPSGPLPGRGRLVTEAEALQLEQEVLAPYQAWWDALAGLGLASERRPLRFTVNDLNIEMQGADALISFSLAAGQYATSVLRELCDYRVADGDSMPE